MHVWWKIILTWIGVAAIIDLPIPPPKTFPSGLDKETLINSISFCAQPLGKVHGPFKDKIGKWPCIITEKILKHNKHKKNESGLVLQKINYFYNFTSYLKNPSETPGW